MQVQGRVVVPMAISVGAFLVNIAGNVALIEAFGFNGAPVATTVSRFAMLLFTLLYMARHALIPGLHFCTRSLDFSSMFSTRGAFMALALRKCDAPQVVLYVPLRCLRHCDTVA
jgi:Na+-driven multidrug efflux pump